MNTASTDLAEAAKETLKVVENMNNAAIKAVKKESESSTATPITLVTVATEAAHKKEFIADYSKHSKNIPGPIKIEFLNARNTMQRSLTNLGQDQNISTTDSQEKNSKILQDFLLAMQNSLS